MDSIQCPHCTNDDARLMEQISSYKGYMLFRCDVCSRKFDIFPIRTTRLTCKGTGWICFPVGRIKCSGCPDCASKVQNQEDKDDSKKS